MGSGEDFTAAFRGEGAAIAGLERLAERMDREEFDLIAIGRVPLGDPHWVTKVRVETEGLKGVDASVLSELV